jgi:hypothetical protein
VEHAHLITILRPTHISENKITDLRMQHSNGYGIGNSVYSGLFYFIDFTILGARGSVVG